jgi:hypothetical protein
MKIFKTETLSTIPNSVEVAFLKEMAAMLENEIEYCPISVDEAMNHSISTNMLSQYRHHIMVLKYAFGISDWITIPLFSSLVYGSLFKAYYEHESNKKSD